MSPSTQNSGAVRSVTPTTRAGVAAAPRPRPTRLIHGQVLWAVLLTDVQVWSHIPPPGPAPSPPTASLGPGISGPQDCVNLLLCGKTNVPDPTWLAGGHERIWGSTEHNREPGCTPPQPFSTDCACSWWEPWSPQKATSWADCVVLPPHPLATQARMWGVEAEARAGPAGPTFLWGWRPPQAPLLTPRTLDPSRIPPWGVIYDLCSIQGLKQAPRPPTTQVQQIPTWTKSSRKYTDPPGTQTAPRRLPLFSLPTHIPAHYSDHRFEDLRPGFEPRLCHIPIVWPRLSNITSVGLSFFIRQVGIAGVCPTW